MTDYHYSICVQRSTTSDPEKIVSCISYSLIRITVIVKTYSFARVRSSKLNQSVNTPERFQFRTCVPSETAQNRQKIELYLNLT